MKTIAEKLKMIDELIAMCAELTDEKKIQETKAMIFTISGCKRATYEKTVPRYIKRAELWMSGDYYDNILFESNPPKSYRIH